MNNSEISLIERDTHSLTCPYCKQMDMLTSLKKTLPSEVILKCGGCSRLYAYERDVEVSFTTRGNCAHLHMEHSFNSYNRCTRCGFVNPAASTGATE